MSPTQAIPFFHLIIFVSNFYVLALEKKKTIVKVPKGTSSYQAAWIVDAETSEHEDDDDSDDDEEDMVCMCTKDEMFKQFFVNQSQVISGVFQLENGQSLSHFTLSQKK